MLGVVCEKANRSPHSTEIEEKLPLPRFPTKDREGAVRWQLLARGCGVSTWNFRSNIYVLYLGATPCLRKKIHEVVLAKILSHCFYGVMLAC